MLSKPVERNPWQLLFGHCAPERVANPLRVKWLPVLHHEHKPGVCVRRAQGEPFPRLTCFVGSKDAHSRVIKCHHGPALPAPLTHLWLATSWSVPHGIRWDPVSGWLLFSTALAT